MDGFKDRFEAVSGECMGRWGVEVGRVGSGGRGPETHQWPEVSQGWKWPSGFQWSGGRAEDR